MTERDSGMPERDDAPAPSVAPPRLGTIVLKRTLASWPLALGAFAAVLLAATLLAAAPMYAGAAANAGLVAKLRDAPVTDAGLEVSARVDADGYDAVDARVRRELAATFGEPVDPARAGESRTLAAPDGRRFALAFFAGIEDEATLAAGRWPRPGTPLEAALSTAGARASGLAVGATLRLAGADGPLDVRIVGEYAVSDRDAALWWADELALQGVRGSTIRTFGPLVLAEESFRSVPGSFRAAWRLRPAAADLDVAALAATARRIDTLEERIGGGTQTSSPAVVATGLDALLDEARRQVTVARSGVVVPLLQLALLAGYGLVFVAALLRGRRAREEELLRTRGAGRRLLAASAAGEAIVLCAAAAALAPWVAAGALRAVDAAGPLAVAGLELRPHVDLAAYALAAAAGLACAAALAFPSLGRDARRRRRGAAGAGPLERAGLDVALLVVVAAALWRLRSSGSPVVASRGGAQIDVLLVAVPALGVLAGAVLAGRLLPLLLGGLARLLDGATAPVALAGRRLARGAREHRPAVLLLVSALAIGTFAAAYATTWSDTQERRALVRSGPGVLVAPDRRSGSYPAIGLARAYRALDGVESVSPTLRRRIEVRDGAAELVAVDAGALAAAAEPGARRLLRDVAAGRRRAETSLDLGPRATELELPFAASLRPVPPGISLRPPNYPFRIRPPELPQLGLGATAVLRDADGILHRVRGVGRPGGPLRFDLVPPGSPARAAQPLRLAALELTLNVPFFIPRRVDVALGPLRVDGRPVPLGDGWRARIAPLPALLRATTARVTGAGDVLRVSLDTGATVDEAVPTVVALERGGAAAAQALPAIAGSGLAESLGVVAGDVLELELGDDRRTVRVAGTLPSFPTVPEGDRFLVVDLPSLAAAAYATRQEVLAPTAWLLGIREGAAGDVVRELELPPLSSESVVERAEVAGALTTDPLAVATSGALWLGFGAAAVFALAAFALAAAARLRAHAPDVAALRAVGLDRRGTRALLLLEGSVLVLLASAGGVLLGAALAELVLPAVAMTETGAASVPPPLVRIPWATVAALTGVLVAALTAVNAIQARRAATLPVAATLREEGAL